MIGETLATYNFPFTALTDRGLAAAINLMQCLRLFNYITMTLIRYASILLSLGRMVFKALLLTFLKN